MNGRQWLATIMLVVLMLLIAQLLAACMPTDNDSVVRTERIDNQFDVCQKVDSTKVNLYKCEIDDAICFVTSHNLSCINRE